MRNIEENTGRAGRTNRERQPRLFTFWFLEDQLARPGTGTIRENPPERSSTRDIALAIFVETVVARARFFRRTQDSLRSGGIERRRVNRPDVNRAANRSIP